MKVLNFGSMNLDYVYTVDHIIEKSETQKAESRKVFAGGKGLNQSVALGRAGVFVNHAGNVGADGEMMLRMLAEANVDTTLVRRRKEEPSGHTVIQVDRNGDNAILVYGGANLSVTQEQVEDTLAYFEEGDLLILQNEINGLKEIMAAAANKGMRIFFNPSPVDDDMMSLPFETVDTFLLNEIEGSALSGVSADEPAEMLDALVEAYPGAHIVLTLGEHGAMYADETDRFRIDALPVDVVDTTGAGDTFTGYYIAGLLEGKSPEDAVVLANRAAAIAVTRPGAAPSIPLRAEVEDLA